MNRRGFWIDRLLSLPQQGLLLLVCAYRFWLKPWLGNACRFEPSCSAYAQQALQQHGAARGAALAGWRLLRCQPWCEGGCDPVPDTFGPPAAGMFTRLKLRPRPQAHDTRIDTRIDPQTDTFTPGAVHPRSPSSGSS